MDVAQPTAPAPTPWTTGHVVGTSTRWRGLRDVVLSLQCKATVLVVVLTLSVTAAVSGYLLRYSGGLVRAEQDLQLRQSAALLAMAIASPLAERDFDHLREMVVEAANGRPLVYVAVSDTAGNMLASTEHQSAAAVGISMPTAPLSSSPPGEPIAFASAGEAALVLDITFPVSLRRPSHDGDVEQEAALLGYVRTGMLANQWQRSMASRLDLVIGVGMVAILAVIPLGFLLIRRILAPVEGLSEAMSQFAEGRLDVKSPVKRRDEIGRLSAAFNKMAEQYRETHQGLVQLTTDLEERVASRTRQLRELASREPLTGLYNRRHFGEVLQRRFAESSRYDTDLSCIMIDLDSFKSANDAFGHHVGDDVLTLTATTILSQLRTADVAARYGGDEFIILLPQTGAERAAVLARRIKEKFSGELADRLPGVSVSMSLGVASLRDLEAPDGDRLVRAADRAMYEAKARGKDGIVMAGLARTTTG